MFVEQYISTHTYPLDISFCDVFHLSFCFIICMIGNSNGSEVVAELQTQHGRLGECIEHLKSVESSRATLVTYLREALHEQVGSWFIVLKALCRFSLFFLCL